MGILVGHLCSLSGRGGRCKLAAVFLWPGMAMAAVPMQPPVSPACISSPFGVAACGGAARAGGAA